MKCPTCGKQTEGRDHNHRGLRCTSCWALLPDKPDPPEVLTFEPEPPKPRRKAGPAKKKPAATT